MYQIKCTNGADLSFVDKYAPKILSVINEYLTKNRTKKLTINNQEIIIGVDKDSLTFKFLTSISTIEKLKKYLLLSPISQFKIVEKLHKCAYEDELIFKKLCKSRYEKYHKNGIIPFDHFNEIFSSIMGMMILKKNQYLTRKNSSQIQKLTFVHIVDQNLLSLQTGQNITLTIFCQRENILFLLFPIIILYLLVLFATMCRIKGTMTLYLAIKISLMES